MYTQLICRVSEICGTLLEQNSIQVGFFVIRGMALPPVPPKRLKVKAPLKGTLARHWLIRGRYLDLSAPYVQL